MTLFTTFATWGNKNYCSRYVPSIIKENYQWDSFHMKVAFCYSEKINVGFFQKKALGIFEAQQPRKREVILKNRHANGVKTFKDNMWLNKIFLKIKTIHMP
jgi:hypothetical protein